MIVAVIVIAAVSAKLGLPSSRGGHGFGVWKFRLGELEIQIGGLKIQIEGLKIQIEGFGNPDWGGLEIQNLQMQGQEGRERDWGVKFVKFVKSGGVNSRFINESLHSAFHSCESVLSFTFTMVGKELGENNSENNKEMLLEEE